MKKLFLVIIALLLPLIVSAQSEDLKIVKLKSGASISGYVSTAEDGSVSVTTKDGDQFWFQSSEVSSINEDPSIIEARRLAEAKAREEEKQRLAIEKAQAKALKKARLDSIKMKEKGFQFILEAGVGYMLSEEMFAPSLILTPGYRINKFLFIGTSFGVGMIDWSFIIPYTTTSLPELDTYYNDKVYGSVFSATASAALSIRYNILAKRVTPYIEVWGGGALPLSGWKLSTSYYDTFGGELGNLFLSKTPLVTPIFGGDVGMMFRTRRGGGLNIGIGLTFAPAPAVQLSIDDYDALYWNLYEFSGTSRMMDMFQLNAKIGWTF